MSHSFAPRAQKLVRKLCLELLKSSKKIRCADLPLRGPLRGGLVSERTRCLSVRFYSPVVIFTIFHLISLALAAC